MEIKEIDMKSEFYPNMLKDIINPSVEYSYIKSYNLPEIDVASVNTAIITQRSFTSTDFFIIYLLFKIRIFFYL